MALANGTMSLLPTHHLATNTGDRLLDCVGSVRVWLIAHHFITAIADVICLFISSILWSSYSIAYLLSPDFRRLVDHICFIIRWPSHENERGFIYVFVLLLKDIAFILVYVSSATLYEWFRSDGGSDCLESMKLQLWMIEATIVPSLLICFAVGYLLDCIDVVFDDYQLIHVVLTVAKIPLFFWMRYAESRSDLGQKRLELRYVVRICEKFVLKHPSV